VAVSGSYDGTVRVWDLATGRERAKLPGDPDDPVWSVAVTADGTVAVSGSWHGTVRVWDLATGKEAAHWTGDSAIIACTPLSGRPLKIAVGQQQGQPYLLELRGQVLAATLSAHDSAWLGVHDRARLGEQLAWGQRPAGTDAWRVTAMLGPGEARDRDCRR